MNKTRKPTHPGMILKQHYLEPLNMPISKFADTVHVSRKTISAIVHERQSVTPEMAMRLSLALDTTPQLWTNLQANYDLWSARHALQEQHVHIKALVAV